ATLSLFDEQGHLVQKQPLQQPQPVFWGKYPTFGWTMLSNPNFRNSPPENSSAEEIVSVYKNVRRTFTAETPESRHVEDRTFPYEVVIRRYPNFTAFHGLHVGFITFHQWTLDAQTDTGEQGVIKQWIWQDPIIKIKEDPQKDIQMMLSK